jgi:uncharacterized membrane protein YkvA (DUF1232 family)
MSNFEVRCLDEFPRWLRDLAADSSALVDLLGEDALSEESRTRIAGGLNYLLKSLDLIPDGVEDLGLLDDAFVLRVSAALAVDGLDDAPEVVARLARDAELVDEFLGEAAPRLRRYVEELQQLAARGRTPQQIVNDPAVREASAGDIAAWADTYRAPSFAPDEKNLVKLRSFMVTKLPS